MSNKEIYKFTIIFLIILTLGIFIILIRSFYKSYYNLYGKRMDSIFAQAEQYEKEKEKNKNTTTSTEAKKSIEESFKNSQINPLNLTFNYPKTTAYSIKNDLYEYVDKSCQIDEKLSFDYKLPKDIQEVSNKEYILSDMSMVIKIDIEKIDDVKRYENYSYKVFVPEYINDKFQSIKEGNYLRKNLKQLDVFDYYYYEVFTSDYYTTYFIIVQNGYVISFNTRTNIEEYQGDYSSLVNFISFLYLTCSVKIAN